MQQKIGDEAVEAFPLKHERFSHEAEVPVHLFRGRSVEAFHRSQVPSSDEVL